MSKISGPTDRPITTKERMSETEQTSETSSIQKTDIETKTRLDSEQTTNEQAPATDTQGQLFENKLGTIVSYDKDGKQKKYTDPDAAGGGDVSAEDIARKMKGRLGQVEHGINPDLGVSGGPTGSGELKHPIDLSSDPIDDGESSVEHLTPEKAKLAADIHGPRTVNPDSGFGGVKPDIKGGADPVPNQGKDID